MPGSLHAWYSLYDLEALAEREATLSGEIELRQLTRLRDVLHSDSGSVQASLKLSRQASVFVTVELTFDAAVDLVCQRCLEPMQHRVSEKVSLVLLDQDSTQGEQDNSREAVVLDNEKLKPASLIEDELIVSLPIVPRHERIDECGKIAQALQAFAPEGESRGADPTS
ncbi:MAG: YceD family protein [Gammaproteobacteria bacterium]